MNGPENRDFVIRAARTKDFPEILAVWKAAGVSFSHGGRESPEAFQRQRDRFPDLYLVATADDRIIGVVLGTHDHRRGWINRLAVLPEYRRRGVAAALVSACEAAIRAHGIEIVAALVETTNVASRALFEKLGYSDEIRIRYFRKASRPGA
jgi:ribosomal protein S18 acetylase RimI-like enzyme